ncbi:MAG: hypothetical protein A2Y59_04925 [Chloroflexi bacterium RBG_13_52_14]|nr:MAG: hypothetical protein A2Y59_04925 [Chloroflexi bacterium RBG_13_52_14]
MQETYLVRAKLDLNLSFEENWESTVPKGLPVGFGPFVLDQSPNKSFYLERLGLIDSVLMEGLRPDDNYPISILYVELMLKMEKAEMGESPEHIADEMFEQLETILRLFQEGNVFLRRHYYHTWQLEDDGRREVIFLWPIPEKPEPATLYHRGLYTLDDKTLQQFIVFFNCYWDIIHGKHQPIYNALSRFNSSYEKRNLGDRLIDLIVALEALFGDRGGGDSLTYKVALRCSSFLYPPGEARAEAFKAIKKIYGDRSAMIHGEKINSRYTSKEIDQLEEQVRRSITAFLEMYRKGHKIKSGEDLDELLFFGKGSSSASA